MRECFQCKICKESYNYSKRQLKKKKKAKCRACLGNDFQVSLQENKIEDQNLVDIFSPRPKYYPVLKYNSMHLRYPGLDNDPPSPRYKIRYSHPYIL